MRITLALLACAIVGGLIGLLIGREAAQTIGILASLALIAALAIAPTDH